MQIIVRPFAQSDAGFVDSIAARLNPGATASPRDPTLLQAYYSSLATGGLTAFPDAAAFVATIDGGPAGVISVHPDIDAFTAHRRAYVNILVVAPEFEGQGVGRALLAYVEGWAQEHECLEVVLDVFANNSDAIAFYERVGYRPDHIRLTKPLI